MSVYPSDWVSKWVWRRLYRYATQIYIYVNVYMDPITLCAYLHTNTHTYTCILRCIFVWNLAVPGAWAAFIYLFLKFIACSHYIVPIPRVLNNFFAASLLFLCCCCLIWRCACAWRIQNAFCEILSRVLMPRRVVRLSEQHSRHVVVVTVFCDSGLI